VLLRSSSSSSIRSLVKKPVTFGILTSGLEGEGFGFDLGRLSLAADLALDILSAKSLGVDLFTMDGTSSSSPNFNFRLVR
jgi:hypothetical protein